MTSGALVFMLASWTFVLSLMSWSFWKILRPKRNGGASDVH